MGAIKFRIARQRSGYYVIGVNSLGPFTTFQRALDLANGMAAALHQRGFEVAAVSIDASCNG